MDQATGYVEDILGCGLMDGQPKINGFVVGHEMKKGIQPVRKVGDKIDLGIVRVCTYGQLVRTAEQRLFRLRDRPKERYESLSG